MLCVWLPLTKDLRNQGLSDVTVTNNGATFNSGGKLGGCYSFDGSDDGIRLDGDIIPILQQGNFSICFWLYSNDSGGRSVYIATTPASDWGFSIEKTTSEQLRVYWQGSPDYVASAFIIPNQEWCHIAVIIKDGNCYCYKNGEKVAERTYSDMTPAKLSRTWVYAQLGRDTKTGTTVLNGKMNDFRWYDHALSPMEVKQISQGLVLHYRLSGIGGENLITTNSMAPISGTNGWGKAGNGWTNSNVVSEGASSGHAIRCTFNGESAVSGGLYHPTGIDKSELINGEIYTISARIRASKPCVATFHNELMTVGNTINLTTDWKTYSYSHAIDNTRTYRSNVIYMRQAYVTQNVWIECDWIKLEKGSTATPWCPNPADSLYSTMGLDNDIEYDISGFNNNGTKIGELTYTTDTPRYTTSTHISAKTQKIYTTNFPTSGFGNSYTFTWWGKRNDNSPMFWGFADGIRLNGMYTGRLWNTGDSDNNPLYNIGTTTQVTAPVNNVWHHYAMTGNGTKCYVYLDGQLWAEAKTCKAISGTSFYINGWNSATDYCSDNTSISDFRIYATALSAEDILTLYNTAATIDNQGNLFTYEVVEG